MADPPIEPKRLADRYRLLEIVGEGGMAVVWKAEDELLGRTVAVKLLRGQYAADPEFLDRLQGEARAAAALNDPGVVAVHDIGQDGDAHFIVMEYVRGRDLKAVIREEAPLPPERAVRMGAEIARAVGLAHAMDLVHRDVKPQNVLVTTEGRLKVADFGIARAITAAGTTAPGLVMGTVHYLAPEVAAGGAATPRSDVYGLGVLLYEMLTGRLPFEADSTVGVVMRIIHESPEPVDVVNPKVPSLLAGIVGRAMAREPADRFEDASALSEALAGFSRWSEQSTAAVPAGRAVPPARPPAATGPTDGPLLDWKGLLLALAALAALAGLVPLWSTVRARYEAEDSPIGLLGPRTRSELPITPQPVPTAAPTVVMVGVPDVTGMEAEAAERRLEADGLRASVEYETSDTVPADRVIRQRPGPGDVVPSEQVVELVVSGQAPLLVPNLAGDWNTVSAALEQMGFVPVRRAVWGGDPSTIDQVLGLDPAPGSRWPRGAPVHVTVNSGPWLALGVDFEDGIHLRGVEIYRDTVAPGEALAFSAVWEAIDVEGEGDGTARGDYVVRARLEGADGAVVAGDEHVPLGGARPTTTWGRGELISGDAFSLPIDPAAPPGSYELWLDLYRNGDPSDVLPIRTSAFARTSGDRARVLTINVLAPEGG